jgi:hypothetical protein
MSTSPPVGFTIGLTEMPMLTVNVETHLEELKEIYQRLSYAYRRRDVEKAVHLTTKKSSLPRLFGRDARS